MGSAAPYSSNWILSIAHLAFMAALCLLLLRACVSSASLNIVGNRKVPVATETTPLARYTVKAVAGWSKKSDGDDGGVMVASESELRRVPSGPDPLHHHGSTPKNPDDQNKLPHTP